MKGPIVRNEIRLSRFGLIPVLGDADSRPSFPRKRESNGRLDPRFREGDDRQHVRRFRGAVEASVAVEFALIGSLLATLITGMADYSLAIWQQIEVSDAARAGAAYASIHGFNSTNIQTAATSATNASVTVSTPVQSCGCAGTSGITSATCGTQCTGLGNAGAGTYVTVTVTSPYTPVLPFPGLSAMTLRATAIARIN